MNYEINGGCRPEHTQGGHENVFEKRVPAVDDDLIA
jgi:hypothetical protein